MATSKYEWLKPNETSDTDLVQHLPSEIWFHIFEYLEFDQAKKIILKLNCQLAYQFLNDENELLYRYLSKWIMKRELESCIVEINGRIIANRDYYDEFIIAHTLPRTPKKSFTCHPKSMSQLRSCLKKKAQRVMNLFPDLYLEKLEDIQQAWIESFSGKLPLKLKPALLQQDPPSDDNFDPKQVEQDDETTNNDHVHKLFPLKFKSGSQRKLKWKSIWNGVNSEYYKSQAISNLESLIQSGTRKIRRITFMAHRKMSLKFSETLEHVYYFLTHMPTKERHEIMFNTRTFTLKTSYDSTRPYLNSDTFSSICYVAYLNQFNTTPFANALEKVIFLFLEECKTYHGIQNKY
ncbi:hypothetical protein C9374_001355 [Naegleria lovaniensis]|uniref:F-box domain-containing protein n=1 Tax=Naegleria lovaniensis TaxID=51637 RepID=A0AA88KNM9_NAELO|nr:uncharacterized protein C9374_001355 [Naegleria lovaniensis]KAG2387761.1 hypothetical protein C9374_001355 [Naegleria lovaniensis]